MSSCLQLRSETGCSPQPAARLSVCPWEASLLVSCDLVTEGVGGGDGEDTGGVAEEVKGGVQAGV